MKNIDVIILAAGKGTRMKSKQPKVMHKLAGRPLLDHVVDTAKSLAPKNIIVVVGHEEETIRDYYKESSLTFVSQKEQLGTGHAVAQATQHLTSSRTLILLGDVPCIHPDSVKNLTECTSDVAVLTQTVVNPKGYGRIVRNNDGYPYKIVEEKDADQEQKLIGEINTGIFCVDTTLLKKFLEELSNNNANEEYYLTDIVEFTTNANLKIDTAEPIRKYEATGINNKRQLA
ncbi:MAG: NTP transferase domain-containing protein, partial [Betaproteobacteria bacterium]|nr:NTP transferase domain-containing protein [Betaproteobacteria bacterium]